MTNITNPSYKIEAVLYENRFIQVCRVRHAHGNNTVIKRLKPEAANSRVQAHFRREFDFLARIDLPGVIKALRLVESDSSLLMELEDIGGESLNRILADGKKLPLQQFLELAAGLAETLARLHGLRIVHKNINPAHIILNTETGESRLIGFDIADELPLRHVALQPPAALEGDLAYLSPEQTGRINRSVDYRTDFYSLGATFPATHRPAAVSDGRRIGHGALSHRHTPIST